MRIEIPAERAAVFSNDGRIFFDIDRLIGEHNDYIDQLPVHVTNEQFIMGMRHALRIIAESTSVLQMENITGINSVDIDTEGN